MEGRGGDIMESVPLVCSHFLLFGGKDAEVTGASWGLPELQSAALAQATTRLLMS